MSSWSAKYLRMMFQEKLQLTETIIFDLYQVHIQRITKIERIYFVSWLILILNESCYKMIGLIQEFQMLRKCCREKHVQNIIVFQPINLKFISLE